MRDGGEVAQLTQNRKAMPKQSAFFAGITFPGFSAEVRNSYESMVLHFKD